MSGQFKIAIIAAMEREVLPLIREWQQIDAPPGSDLRHLWISGEAVLACAGIGAERARIATNVLIEAFRPELVTSIGFAGALVPKLKIGDVLQPAKVVSIQTGTAYAAEIGCGVLATSEVLLGSSQKKSFAAHSDAVAVDMEAGVVAKVAAEKDIRFRAIKAVSDDVSDVIEITAPFIEPGTAGRRGRFQTQKFVKHVVVRPWLWGKVLRLAKNSKKASEALCRAVKDLVRDPNVVSSSIKADVAGRQV